jgi:hypothetical protein
MRAMHNWQQKGDTQLFSKIGPRDTGLFSLRSSTYTRTCFSRTGKAAVMICSYYNLHFASDSCLECHLTWQAPRPMQVNWSTEMIYFQIWQRENMEREAPNFLLSLHIWQLQDRSTKQDKHVSLVRPQRTREQRQGYKTCGAGAICGEIFWPLPNRTETPQGLSLYICVLFSVVKGVGWRREPLLYIGGRLQLPFSCDIFFCRPFNIYVFNSRFRFFFFFFIRCS